MIYDEPMKKRSFIPEASHSRLIPILTVLAAFSALSPACSLSLNLSDEADKKADAKGPHMVEMDLRTGLDEAGYTSDFLSESRPTLWGIMKRIKKLEKSTDVAGIFLHLGAPLSWTAASDLSQALNAFRGSGRKVLCHLGEADNVNYSLSAASCDRIVMSPGGELDITGLAVESLYLKGLLDSIGVEAQFFQMGKYKGAAEPLTRDSMSPELRENLESLLDDRYGVLVESIASGRKLDADKVRGLIDIAPFSPDQALDAGLVDQVATPSEIKLSLKSHYAGGVVSDCECGPSTSLDLGKLIKILSGGGKTSAALHEPHVAMVYAIGAVLPPGADVDFFSSQNMIEPSRLESTLEEIAENEDIKAVVLRIDSPGGSALGSDDIWNAVRLLSQKKPVIASLGDVAASGGYYIASAANKIVASPGTLTGSIGVVGGKIVLDGLFKKVNARTELIKRGERAGWSSPGQPFTEGEKIAFEAMLAKIYELFLSRVAAGRNLAVEEVSKAAEGRVLSGKQALEMKLADELGGIEDAVMLARKLGELDAKAPIEIYPRSRGFLEMLGERIGREAEPDTIAPDMVRASILRLLFEREKVLALAVTPNALDRLLPRPEILSWMGPGRRTTSLGRLLSFLAILPSGLPAGACDCP